ncbi:MAG: sigma-54 interaction domain-containing protein [Fidelibacterota bacterium]
MGFLIGCPAPDSKADVTTFRELIKILKRESWKITKTHDWISALSFAAVHEYDAIWMDWILVQKDYSTFYNKLGRMHPTLPLIIVSHSSEIDAQLCEQNRILFAVLHKDQFAAKVPALLHRLQLYQTLKAEIPPKLKGTLSPTGLGAFIGNSKEMLELYQQITRVAAADFTVLIKGKSGSGKEVVARTLHELSPRAKKRFVGINCAAIPENLLESELFGYEKGAFTDAQQAKPGKFELAHGGTLFLDEIGDMPLPLQAKLLRVLDDHQVERLGGTKAKKIDVRLVSATNQDLKAKIETGKFRADLFYRLNVIPLLLKPITKRGDDILILVLQLLGKLIRNNSVTLETISWDFIRKIQSLPIKGNVRELENILTRSLFQISDASLDEKDLKVDLPTTQTDQPPAEILPLWKVEKNVIEQTLGDLDWNLSQVAKQLEISRTALYRKMKKYDLSREDN